MGREASHAGRPSNDPVTVLGRRVWAISNPDVTDASGWKLDRVRHRQGSRHGRGAGEDVWSSWVATRGYPICFSGTESGGNPVGEPELCPIPSRCHSRLYNTKVPIAY